MDQDYVMTTSELVNRLFAEALQQSQEAHRLWGELSPLGELVGQSSSCIPEGCPVFRSDSIPAQQRGLQGLQVTYQYRPEIEDSTSGAAVDQDYVMSSFSGWIAACELALSINKLALARFCPLWAMGELYGQALRTVQPLP